MKIWTPQTFHVWHNENVFWIHQKPTVIMLNAIASKDTLHRAIKFCFIICPEQMISDTQNFVR